MPVAPLSAHGIAVLLGLVAVFVIFARDRIPIVVTSLAVIAVLAAGFFLFPYRQPDGTVLPATEFFAGFGHPALVAICALMILGRGLVVTGALEPLARLLSSLWQRSALLALFVVLVAWLALSGVLNDTPIVVFMTPLLVSLAARTSSSAAPILMPMNYAVLIGGMATSIGTSTNLLVVSLAADLGARPFGVFDFTPLVALAAIPAFLYLWLVVPRILAGSGTPAERVASREYDAVLRVLPGSFAAGKTLAEILERASRIPVRGLVRPDGQPVAKLPTTVVGPDFRLRIRGTADQLRDCEAMLGGTLSMEEEPDHRDPSPAEEHHLVEMIVSGDSGMIGRPLGQLYFGAIYGLQLLGIHRDENPSTAPDVRDWRLHAGDVLLLQGSTPDIERAKRDGDLLALDGMISVPRTSKAFLALAIIAGVVLAAATGIMPIAIAAVLGAVVMLLTGCVLPRNLGKAVSPEVILLIPASLALGKALTVTGGAAWVAGLLQVVARDLPVGLVLGGIIALMSLLTNFISNNAAAVIGTPIAIAIAADLGAPPEPFALAVLFGCNLCFATPMAYQTNLIVMSAAGYRFADFLKAGLPLVVLMVAAFSWLLPRWYGL